MAWTSYGADHWGWNHLPLADGDAWAADTQNNGNVVGNGKGKGTGKGKAKGKARGGKPNWGPYEPPPGSRLRFSSYNHAFYTDFPGGEQVTADATGVDYDAEIQVLQTASAPITRMTRWNGEETNNYIAVCFRTTSDWYLWTNFSRNGTLWMIPIQGEVVSGCI